MSAAPVKSTIDEQLQRLFDALVSSLRKARVSRASHVQSITRDMAAVDAFVDKGAEALSARPQTVEEIAAVTAVHGRLSGEKAGVQLMFPIVDAKNRLLR